LGDRERPHTIAEFEGTGIGLAAMQAVQQLGLYWLLVNEPPPNLGGA